MNFLSVIGRWINTHFSNEDAIYLILLIITVLVVLVTLGGYLAPVLTGLVLAFLLQGLVSRLEGWQVPRSLAVASTFLLFVGGVLTLVLVVVPLIWSQLQGLVELLPRAVTMLRSSLQELVLQFPEYVTQQQVDELIDQGTREIGNFSATVVETAFSQVFSIFGLLIYLILTPIAVFFFLKDKDLILAWVRTLVPLERPMLAAVAAEMNDQLGNYVRGKFIEIMIVGAVTFFAFSMLGLNYAALLGVLVGLSVLIPFVGAALVTIPVFIVAVIQFGWGWDLAWVMGVYGVIQFLDGNVLVPVLFSEVVDLHPITIVVAVLAFGGLWGVWGVFFAIPLATLIKAIYKAWPSGQSNLAASPQAP